MDRLGGIGGVKRNAPALVVHADWSTQASKRWMACAVRVKDGHYKAQAPEAVGAPESLLKRLRERAGSGGAILVGFDFPIGLPGAYARKCNVDYFLELLPDLGQGAWRDFYRVAEQPDEIHLRRPFYPLRPGETRQAHLLRGLGVGNIDDLRRQCELPYEGRRAAAPLFWTLGGQQVGKAAIIGWRDVLAPALRQKVDTFSIWPFSGRLVELLRPGAIVVAETYPGEFYNHLGVDLRAPGSPTGEQGAYRARRGKRAWASRAANAQALLGWATRAQVSFTAELRALIQQGFGPRPGGEDPFDATVGLFGMLNVVLGFRDPGEPGNQWRRDVEGWILGQRASVSRILYNAKIRAE